MHPIIANLITRQFSGCFVEGISIQKFKKINHKTLKVVFNNDDGYNKLFQMSNEITTHQTHLRANEKFLKV